LRLSRARRSSSWTIALGGARLGALLFGAYHHFVMISPDNIGHLPHGSAEALSTFVATASALALLELASALYGAFCLGSLLRASATLRGAGKA
jgi:hypothetical protein